MTEEQKKNQNSFANTLKQAQKAKTPFNGNHNIPKPTKGYKNTTTVRRSGRGG